MVEWFSVLFRGRRVVRARSIRPGGLGDGPGGGCGVGVREVDEFEVGAVGEDEEFVAGVAACRWGRALGGWQWRRGGYGKSEWY
jgi:hypothetical protein